MRVFVDQGAPMAALVGKLARTRPGRGNAACAPPDYLRRLVMAFQQDATANGRPGRHTAVVAGLIQQLSGRELEVLQHMAAGRSNREIADELVVVVDTVKKHVGRILDKLGAVNRTQAVAHARELGLLP